MDAPETSNSDRAAFESRYQLYREMLFHAVDNQAQYGRWVVASLLAVHAGGLIAITQSGNKAPALFAAAGAYLIGGLVLALVAGGLAWLNFSAAILTYADVLDSMLKGKEPAHGRATTWVAQITLWGTPFVAATSLALFVVAAWAALKAI